MTDSENTGQAGKRDRLIASAADLLHHQGVQATTLAHVASAADVPLGNVYYYFKTKDDLIRAVIAARAEQAIAMLGKIAEQHPTPRARLAALARSWSDMRDLVAQHGCPFGTLCSELDKRADDLTTAAAGLLNILIDWAEHQFQQLTRSDPRELAVFLISEVQGAALLTNTLRDPDIIATQVRRLEKWLATVR